MVGLAVCPGKRFRKPNNTCEIGALTQKAKTISIGATIEADPRLI